MAQTSRTAETPKRNTNVWALLALAILTLSVSALFGSGLSQLDREVAALGQRYVSPGNVLGVETVKQAATLAIDGGGVHRTYDFDLTGRTTAYDLLTRASLKDVFQLDVKQYDFGVFIEGIDGVKGDASRFWAFYVNGQQAPVGADSYVVKAGDTIEFRLEAIQ